MAAIRSLSDTVWAAPQLDPADLPALAASGVRRVISNRPDGEEAGQPSASHMETAARDAGMDFVWIPIAGLPGPDQVRAVAEQLADGTPTVMFCRSGMRSAAAWALSERMGGADADGVRAAAAAAGYDLSRLPL